MALRLLLEAAPLCGADTVHRLSYPRHVPGQEEEAHVEEPGHNHDAFILQAEKKSSKLRGASSNQNCSEEEGGKRNTDRTTRLLVTILVLFLIAEVPQVDNK